MRSRWRSIDLYLELKSAFWRTFLNEKLTQAAGILVISRKEDCGCRGRGICGCEFVASDTFRIHSLSKYEGP